MRIGCQTHFENNSYPLSLFSGTGLVTLDPDLIRDELTWSVCEVSPGIYTFNSQWNGYMADALTNGIDVLFEADFANPLYDQGFSPYTPAGIQAYVNYIVACLNKYPQIKMVEVWNEWDSLTFNTGPATRDPPYFYAALLAAVYPVLRARGVLCVGGAPSTPGLTYIRHLAAHGAFANMDIFSFHYPPDDGLTQTLEQINQVILSARGSRNPLPIAVTEYGAGSGTPDLISRSITKMSAFGCPFCSYYQGYNDAQALISGAPAITNNGNAFIQMHGLLAGGNAVRVSTGDPSCYVYQFGTSGNYIAWGRYGQAITITGGGVTYFDSSGNSVSAPTNLTYSPIIIMGATGVFVQPVSNWLDNTRIGFQGPNWSYYSHRGGAYIPCGTMQYSNVPLEPGWYAEVLGDPVNTAFFQIAVFSTVVEPYTGVPVLRWTSPYTGTLKINGYVTAPNGSSTGCVFSIKQNGSTTFTHNVLPTAQYDVPQQTLTVAFGDQIEFWYDAVGNNYSFASFKTEMQLSGS